LLNPIVIKELRQAVKSWLVVIALLVFLALQLIILGAFLMLSEGVNRNSGEVDFQAGRTAFMILQPILLSICMLLIPAYAGVRLAFERSDINVDLFFITTLKPRSIIWGKFCAAVVLILLIFSACAPFMTFTYLLRGIDIPTILLVLAIDFLTVLAGTQFAVFLGAMPAHWVFKLLLGLWGFGCLMMLLYLMSFATFSLVQFGIGVPLDSWEFWGPALAILVGIVAVVGLLFSWSVALVSPASSNRALPVRIFMMVQWLATGVAAALVSRQFSTYVPVAIWAAFSVWLCCLQLHIAINEREQWAPRVARTIPRWIAARLPAFLFYSGAAGGLAFGVLFVGLTILAAHLWRVWNPALDGKNFVDTFLEMLLVAGLYALCYCLMGVLFRTYLAGGRIKLAHTWIVVLVFTALGSVLPYIFAYVCFGDVFRSSHEGENWWLLPNPFASIADVALHDRYHVTTAPFQSLPLAFSAAWAVIMVILSLPWYLRQVSRFHPPRPAPAKGGREVPVSVGHAAHAPHSASEVVR
jgi:hypothetical protein